ncbi:YoaK family protein [Ilumatobacter sp.]|uniref:YoaK family protein n=1 Tax=Ilumatobacter sp. TaxID=1967498 RepID=UPI003C648312
MTAETAHHPSGPLVLAFSLAGIAGFIDAHLFLYVTNVFVANMSGNMVRVGIFGGSGDWSIAAGSLAALFAFATGVVVAIAHHDRRLQQNKTVRPDELLVVEALLTLSLPMIVIVCDVEFSNQASPVHYLVIGVGALAMGLQASSLRRVGSIAVATTYGTGTIVRIGEKVALGLRGAERTSVGRRSATVIVLVGVLACYVGGAAAASALGSAPLLLLIPSAILLAFVVYIRSSPGFRAAYAESRTRRAERRTTDY